jgi:hypothetical protein
MMFYKPSYGYPGADTGMDGAMLERRRVKRQTLLVLISPFFNRIPKSQKSEN